MKAIDAIQYTGENDRAVCEFAHGSSLPPFALSPGFWQRQNAPDDFTLMAPARSGEVEMHPGDWYVKEPGGYVRLSDIQMNVEHPDLRMSKLREDGLHPEDRE